MILRELRKIRIEKGLTLKKLSEKTEISISYLNDLELLYKINPSEKKVEKITMALNINKEELQGDD